MRNLWRIHIPAQLFEAKSNVTKQCNFSILTLRENSEEKGFRQLNPDGILIRNRKVIRWITSKELSDFLRVFQRQDRRITCLRT